MLPAAAKTRQGTPPPPCHPPSAAYVSGLFTLSTLFREHTLKGHFPLGSWHLLVGPHGPRSLMLRVMLGLLRMEGGSALG